LPTPGPRRTEPIVALVLALGGMAMTTWAAFHHVAQLVVPGSTLILVGGAWLGCALARNNVRLLPFFPPGEPAPGASGDGEGQG
jgi:hypothetical protein